MAVFVNQKKHKTTDTWENGILVKSSEDAGMHQFHAFMSTYAYGQDATVDYCACSVETEDGLVIVGPEIDDRRAVVED